jgi:hypothetical protein
MMMSNCNMNSDSESSNGDEMRPHYDFSKAVRGKYAERFAQGTNLVLLQPDVAKEFPDSESVHQALRSLLKSRKHRRGA